MNRSNKIALLWTALLIFSVIMLLYGASVVKQERNRDTKSFDVKKIAGWSVEYTKEPNIEGKYVVKYSNKLGEVSKGGDFLMFFLYHSDVEVYSEGILMYSMRMNKEDTFFPTVSGDTWNCLYVPEEYANKPIDVIVTCDYDAYLEYVPDFYYGDRSTIIRYVISEDMLGIFLTFLMCFVGVVIVIYSIVVSRNKENHYDLIYLGIFAIMLSGWLVLNSPCISMIFDIGTIFTYMSYIILGTITVPLVLFEKKLLENKYKKACDGVCIYSIISFAIIVSLQLLGIRDMKETLIFTHLGIGVSIVVLVTLLVMDVISVGITNLGTISKVNIICGGVTALGVAADIIYYYIDANDGKSYIFTKVTFLVHIISICVYSMRETQRLMHQGKKAQTLEKLAYRDELTGMYNRTAFNSDMRKLDIHKNVYTVIMFDLNNLKKCNDTLGHNFGDSYIISCANSIRDGFIEIGNCYRIGGDEFCVIAKDVSENKVQSCYRYMEKQVDKYNEKNRKVHMSIACGHASYDNELDEDLKDTRGRADKIMYKNKLMMKGQE